MKKIISSTICILIMAPILAQNTFPSSGNAGVGTSTPTAPFTIRTTLSQGNTVFDFGNPQQFNQVIFRDRSNASFLYGVE